MWNGSEVALKKLKEEDVKEFQREAAMLLYRFYDNHSDDKVR